MFDNKIITKIFWVKINNNKDYLWIAFYYEGGIYMETKNNSAEKQKVLTTEEIIRKEMKEVFCKMWNENHEELIKNLKGKKYCVLRKPITYDWKMYDDLIYTLADNVYEYVKELENNDDISTSNYLKKEFYSNMNKISHYVKNKLIFERILDNTWQYIENSSYDSLSQEYIIVTMKKIVNRSVVEIMKEKSKGRKIREYDR